MNNALALFNYNGSQVRTILDERTGEPWWVAKDVCDVLGLGNITEALRNLDDDEKSSLNINVINSEVDPHGIIANKVLGGGVTFKVTPLGLDRIRKMMVEDGLL